MMEWFGKIVAMLPVKGKFVGLALLVGLFTGGAVAEGAGAWTQVGENTETIAQLDSTVADMDSEITEVNAKLDMVLCILVLDEDISPLTCAPGGRE